MDGGTTWTADPEEMSAQEASSWVEPTMEVLLDMETGDPDDILTLVWLLACEGVRLRAVTLWPGGMDQVAFVRSLLANILGPLHHEVLVGASNKEGSFVAKPHYASFGVEQAAGGMLPGGDPVEIMLQTVRDFPDVIFLCCGPLGNLNNLLQRDAQFLIKRMVVQGGFAGSRCVENPMPKFAGLCHCPTWNFGGCVPGALAMLEDPRIGRRLLVSKDVAHSAVMDEALFERLNENPRLRLIQRWAERDFPRRRKTGKFKAMHDPLAACVMTHESIVTFKEVVCERVDGKWGSFPQVGTNVFISVALDQNAFHEQFLRCKIIAEMV